MKIGDGFQIELPQVFVPWGISESRLERLLKDYGLKKVTHGYYTISCTSLGGLRHELGFHFTPRHNGALTELEFYRNTVKDLNKSFDEFQRTFENSFGWPTTEQRGACGFPTFTWALDTVQIVHYVFDRFGPEEHMRIKKV